MDKQEEIYQLVSKIPKGKVTTYGQIAKTLKIKNPRIVGYYMHRNPNQELIPCHRVVNSVGKLAKNFAFGGLKGQKEKLSSEGVIVKNYQLELKKYLWQV